MTPEDDSQGRTAADFFAEYSDDYLVNVISQFKPEIIRRGFLRLPGREVTKAVEVEQAVQRLRTADEARRIYAEENRPPRESLDVGTLAQHLAKPDPPPARIQGLMGWEAGMQVIAMRKTGKTTLALNMAHAFLTGEPFLGEFPVVPVEGRVALLNHEVSGYQIAGWAAQRGIPEDRLLLVNLRGASNPFRNPDALVDLADALRAHNVETVMVDPFGRAFSGDNQNDAGQVNAWLLQLDEFARAMVGARDVVLTVHAGWEGNHARGSSALEDWGDSLVYLTRDKNTGARHISADGRDVEMPKRELILDEGTKALTLGEATRPARKDGPREDLMEAVSQRLAQLPAGHDGLTTRTLRSEVTGKGEDISAAVDMLHVLGFVKREQRGQSVFHTLVKPFTPAAEDFS